MKVVPIFGVLPHFLGMHGEPIRVLNPGDGFATTAKPAAANHGLDLTQLRDLCQGMFSASRGLGLYATAGAGANPGRAQHSTPYELS